MEELLIWIEMIEDKRQQSKVRHKLSDIVLIVLFAMLGNADEWEEIELFAACHIDCLRKYIDLENGVPSHDTIRRVMGMISPTSIQKVYEKWNELLSSEEGEKLKKIINIDGKTMRGNKVKDDKPQHIVSAWCHSDGFCLGQKVVEEKTNEITAIPQLLDTINVKNCVITIDAIGTQTEIAKKIKDKRADYVLSVKENQLTLYNNIKEYFSDKEFCEEIQTEGNYIKTVEKAHGQIEIREYYQTGKINWLPCKGKWKGIKSIGIVRKTIQRDDETVVENRYYISSLEADIEMFAKAVRQHWEIEIMHWHLDVTFKEDANKTQDKIASQNMNIIRKWCLSILRLLDVGKKMSLKRKRYYISMKTEELFEKIMNL